jgi:hypothetical protein
VKNLGTVFAAYIIGWAVFFVFYVTVARRTSQLKDELDRLRDSVKRGK